MMCKCACVCACVSGYVGRWVYVGVCVWVYVGMSIDYGGMCWG